METQGYVRNNIIMNDGYVPRHLLMGLSARERNGRQSPANAIGAVTSFLPNLKLVVVIAEARKMRPDERGTLARYELLRAIGVAHEAQSSEIMAGENGRQPIDSVVEGMAA